MPAHRYVIIGGDAAGMSAAMQIRRAHPEASVTTFERGGTYSYAQCGLPYWIGGDISSPDRLIARSREVFQEKYQIDARVFQEVTEVDPQEQVVRFRDLLSGEVGSHPYSKLLIATGGRAVRPPWEGTELAGVFVLKSLHDAERIKEYAARPEIHDVVIVGAGYIGLEMAEAFYRLGKRVSILNRGEQVAGPWDKEMAALAEEELRRHGVAVHQPEEVTGLGGDQQGRVREVETKSGWYRADLVLVAVGLRPNSEIAEAAGVQLGVGKAIEVNEKMETNVPGIWAAGDVATQYHRLKKRPDVIPLGTHANKMGRIAGKQMALGQGAFHGVIGTAILKLFDLGLARTGLSEAEARQEGVAVKTVTLETRDHAGYYPGAKPLTIKLVIGAQDGRLLGGQAVGYGGVDKRIDVLATAIWQGMRAEELLDLDLSYAPPFNAVWDPLQQAARREK